MAAASGVISPGMANSFCAVSGVALSVFPVTEALTTPDALEVLRGLQQVLSGQSTSYRVTYPCHSPGEQRWFVMNAAALRGSEPGAVVSHFDITPWHALVVAGSGAAGA